jgi:hypothetical protein
MLGQHYHDFAYAGIAKWPSQYTLDREESELPSKFHRHWTIFSCITCGHTEKHEGNEKPVPSPDYEHSHDAAGRALRTLARHDLWNINSDMVTIEPIGLMVGFIEVECRDHDKLPAAICAALIQWDDKRNGGAV